MNFFSKIKQWISRRYEYELKVFDWYWFESKKQSTVEAERQ